MYQQLHFEFEPSYIDDTGTLQTASISVDELLQALSELGALSVAMHDAYADTLDEVAMYQEPNVLQESSWKKIRVEAMFTADDDIPALLAILEEELAYSIASPKIEVVHEQNWVALTQSQFPPMYIKNVAIIPSWHLEEEAAKLPNYPAVLALDPGLAFGTGSHPTTHLCIEWLSDYFAGNLHLHHQAVQTPQTTLSNLRILDYGCGSGILAMVAAKLGAQKVFAVDIDEQALQATRENARCNQVELSIHHSQEDMHIYLGSMDVVVANILSNPLKVLAPLLVKFLRQDVPAYLVLSGILARQAQEIQAHYAPYLKLEVFASKDDWVCMWGRV